MIKRYFNGVIKQVHEQVGVAGKNIVMILCGNDFPADAEWSIKRYSADEEDSVFLLTVNTIREVLRRHMIHF